MKPTIIRSDSEYNKAINYTHLYNYPTTLNINKNKYVLGCGNNDDIKFKTIGNELFILSSNKGLNYVSLEVITLVNVPTNLTSVVFLEDNDLSNKENICYNLLNKSVKKQFEILIENYL